MTALVALGETGRDRLLDLLGDEQWQDRAGGALVELGEDVFPVVAALLDSDDELRRRGALQTVYLYARYRDLPAAHELLRAVAASPEHADLADAAARMSAKVDQLAELRNAEIDRSLDRIGMSMDRDKRDRGSVALRMYLKVHHSRMEAVRALVGMRYAALRHVVAAAPQVGDAAVAAILALSINELGGGVVPAVAEGLQADRRTRGLMIAALLCLRRARIPGAAEALDEAGIKVTESMDRRAAHLYRQWVREK
jgi:hypothetical protein